MLRKSRKKNSAIVIFAIIASAALGTREATASTDDVLEQLPSTVVGVVGSGENISLEIKEDGSIVKLQIGKTYKDQWVLVNLDSAVATFSNGKTTRKIGLNPEGTVEAESENSAPSNVIFVGGLSAQDNALVEKEKASGRWDGKPKWGLSQDETERLVAYDSRRDAAYAAWYKANWKAGMLASQIPGRPSEEDAVGENADDYDELAKIRAIYQLENQAADLSNNPPKGASNFYLPAGDETKQVMTELGIDPRGNWNIGPADNSGGRMVSRVGQ